MTIDVRPVGPAQWDDIETLFGPAGAEAGCWCMWWRVSGRQFSANRNVGNWTALKGIVGMGEEVGLLAYLNGEPVGWMALAPREVYQRVLRSPTLKPRDTETGVWAVPCFFIHRYHRREGVAEALIRAALGHARAGGASIVEGYPADVEKGHPADLFTGTVKLFTKAGFKVHERPAQGRRVIMRRSVRPGS